MIPFQNIDPKYLAKLDAAANECRGAVKNLKLLIAEHESEVSPAHEWAQHQHNLWKRTCSATIKAMKALKVDPKGCPNE